MLLLVTFAKDCVIFAEEKGNTKVNKSRKRKREKVRNEFAADCVREDAISAVGSHQRQRMYPNGKNSSSTVVVVVKGEVKQIKILSKK